MVRLRLSFVFVVLASLAAACTAKNPLEGEWTASASEGTVSASVTLDFGSGGEFSTTLAFTEIDGQACTGAITFSGLSWSSTDSTITLSGKPTCQSTLMCGGVAASCDDIGASSVATVLGTGGYTLENDDDTLVLHGSGADETYTRKH